MLRRLTVGPLLFSKPVFLACHWYNKLPSRHLYYYYTVCWSRWLKVSFKRNKRATLFVPLAMDNVFSSVTCDWTVHGSRKSHFLGHCTSSYFLLYYIRLSPVHLALDCYVHPAIILYLWKPHDCLFLEMDTFLYLPPVLGHNYNDHFERTASPPLP